jgi:glucose-1-phosphate thymidylyltransferase
MICKSIGCLKRMGIEEILIVLGGHSGNSFFDLLGDGHRFDLSFSYAYQERAGGIADALRLAKGFVGGRNVAVILGDNVFAEDMSPYLQEFENDNENECYLFLKEVDDPQSFGIAWVDSDGSIIDLAEKPESPDSNLAVTGLYFYSPRVFDLIDDSIELVGPSERGELEITDINRFYMSKNLSRGIRFGGYWADCGTKESLLQSSILMKEWNLGNWLAVGNE